MNNDSNLSYLFGKGDYENYADGLSREWILSNGIGGYATSTIIDCPIRAHNGLLIASLNPPIERYLILNKLNERLHIGHHIYDAYSTIYNTDESLALSLGQKLGASLTKQVGPESSTNVEGFLNLADFTYSFYPKYEYRMADASLSKEVLLVRGKNQVIIKYHITAGREGATLDLSPAFNFEPMANATLDTDGSYLVQHKTGLTTLKPQGTSYEIQYAYSCGSYQEYPEGSTTEAGIYLAFEAATGMQTTRSSYCPIHHWVEVLPYMEQDFYVMCKVVNLAEALPNNFSNVTNNCSDDFNEDSSISLEALFTHTIKANSNHLQHLIDQSGASSSLHQRLVLSADPFIVDRKSTGNKTILAGFPWFTDWGRDTMIAMQGLTLATHRDHDSASILRSFAKYQKNGLLPNMFPDGNEAPLYNSVDASLWYFVVVYDYYLRTTDLALIQELYPILDATISHFMAGTDFSICMTDDGLLHAGSGLDQVTWMDVRTDGKCVTPRHGKPVEINALWYNALRIMDKLNQLLDQKDVHHVVETGALVKSSFQAFWNNKDQCLYDVIDDVTDNETDRSPDNETDKIPDNETDNEHHNRSGHPTDYVKDASIRPNQIYAVSLPFQLLDQAQARAVVDTVHQQLYTDYGLRSLSPSHEDYKPHYSGQLKTRDYAYHQGTVWGFLLGPFVIAYHKVYPKVTTKELMTRFIDPAVTHLSNGCLGGYGEIFDGDSPHHHRGCCSQAWSVGEILHALDAIGYN